MFIKNYGLFWKRDDVWWGKRGNKQKGEFKGKKNNTENSRIVDFKNQIGFYVLYNIEDNRSILDVRDVHHAVNNRDSYDTPYNGNDRLVYCGYSGKKEAQERALFHRIKQHQQPHRSLYRRWNQFSWFGIGNLGDDDIFPQIDANNPDIRPKFLKQIEAVIIATSRPIENIESGSFKPAKRYLQPPHPYPRFRN